MLLALLQIGVARYAGAEPVWVNGQAARLVIGQTSFRRANPESSQRSIGGAAGLAIAGDSLFVADGNEIGAAPLNNRVLIYNHLSSFIPDSKAELPQPDLSDRDETSGNICLVCDGIPDVVVGQADFDSFDPSLRDGLNNPVAVASDGVRLAVADVDNNRVLIWNQIPTVNGTPPDVVVGQSNFRSSAPATTRDGMRGPQGVWIDNGRLFVADTINSRVLIYNTIPTSNGERADVVVGQPDFTTRPEPDLTLSNYQVTVKSMLDPISVTVTDGRMFVTDLGFNRVLIYNTVPTENYASADVVIGQPDFIRDVANNTTALCEPLPEPAPSNIEEDEDEDDEEETCTITEAEEFSCSDGIDNDCDGDIDFFNDDDCGPEYPARCERTLNFPRFAISDGQSLYVADGGNDRVLIFNEIPDENGAAADVVLGQADFQSLVESPGAGGIRAPSSLATDGTNLYVTDPFSRRIMVFTPGEDMISQDGLVNAAAYRIPANGSVFLQGDLEEEQETKVIIGNRQFVHTAVEGDNAEIAAAAFIELINNDGDAEVTAVPAVSAGTYADRVITFEGEVRAGDSATITVAGETYTAHFQEGDEVHVMVDRLVFEVNQNPNAKIFAERYLANDELNELHLIHREVGRQGNVPLSVSVSPEDAPFTAEVVLDPDEEDEVEDAEEEGEEPPIVGETLSGGELAYGFLVFAKEPGPDGNEISISTSTSVDDVTAPSSSGQQLSGGSDARELPVGTIASIFGIGFAEQVWQAESAIPSLPTELGGVRVYVNGLLAPLYIVTPNQINFQVPFEIVDSTSGVELIEGASMSVYIWRRHEDGTITVSTPRAADVARATPGIFAYDGPEPRRAIAVHGSGVARGTVSITPVNAEAEDEPELDEGTEVTITINGRNYVYTTVDEDKATAVREGLVALINAGDGDPDVVASIGQEGFFSARADVTLEGEIDDGDVVTIFVRDRAYSVAVDEDEDSITTVRNKLVFAINDGQGDPEVTARCLNGAGDDPCTSGFDPSTAVLQVVARILGEAGNSIPFRVEVNRGADIDATVSEEVEEEGFLRGGQGTTSIVLTARVSGSAGNNVTFSASSSDETELTVTTRRETLCCGNEPFSLITDDNPAVPGETITVFGTGFGLTGPTPLSEGIHSGQPTPSAPYFYVPFIADDFVSSLVQGTAAVIEFVGLMPGQVGVYQINMRLNEGLRDNPASPLTLAQVLSLTNVVTIPVKNLRPTNNP